MKGSLGALLHLPVRNATYIRFALGIAAAGEAVRLRARPVGRAACVRPPAPTRRS